MKRDEPKNKKEEISPIQLEIRSLSKKFKCLSREGIRIIHEFCQYDVRRTHRVMSMVQEMKNPSSFIEALIKKPEKSQEVLIELENKYLKKFGDTIEEKTEEKEEALTKEQVPKIDYYFFQFVHNDTVQKIMSYLDPYSFVRFSLTAKYFHQISVSEAQADYYKVLCKNLFTFQNPKMPLNCRFLTIRDYVLQRPLEYRPNTRNAVQNNLRNYIWKMDFNSFTLQPSYFKSFGSYQCMFKRCPRLNLNGYYVLRDKYVRIGEKNQKNPITPIHIIYYYRYLRFVEDGSVLYHVRNKRLKPDQIMSFLSKQLLEQNQNKEVIIGEYIHHKDKLFVKAAQSRQVFSYEFQIRSTDNQINNELKILLYTLQLIDDQMEILQTLYKDHPTKEDRCFVYIPNQEIKQENSPMIQANSL